VGRYNRMRTARYNERYKEFDMGIDWDRYIPII